MATKGNSFFWLANVKKIFSSETAWPNGAKLGRKHLCKVISKGDNHYLKKQQPSWMEGGAVGHNFERDTPRDHLCQVWTLHKCFLSILAPFAQAVSEENLSQSEIQAQWAEPLVYNLQSRGRTHAVFTIGNRFVWVVR
jgi:hypothetical protein